jgi:hypothetical protein
MTLLLDSFTTFILDAKPYLYDNGHQRLIALIKLGWPAVSIDMDMAVIICKGCPRHSKF